MKKGIVYILLLAVLLLSLAACGASDKPATTESPRPTSSTSMPTPDMNDGIVNDNDGIIDDDDTGIVPTQTPMASASAKPSASAGTIQREGGRNLHFVIGLQAIVAKFTISLPHLRN